MWGTLAYFPLVFAYCNAINDAKGFDDSILFDINWPGANSLYVPEESEYMIVHTAQKESYKCILPHVEEKEDDSKVKYSGPSPLQLLSPLLAQSACSYRLESYWTYEVCHGRHIRQYHEERENKKLKLQEYILGRWDNTNYDFRSRDIGKDEVIPHKKIDGVNLPYFEIWMENGTECDLNQNKPRRTKVLYVCYVHGKHEIYSLKEISTCLYEIVVLSPLLCAHPKYKPKETGEHKISCLPLDGSPNKPKNLIELTKKPAKKENIIFIPNIKIKLLNEDSEGLDGSQETLLEDEHELERSIIKSLKAIPEMPKDSSPVDSFLKGKNCLHGGNSKGNDFWKFEFCYGKSIDQYHIYEDGHKSSISLGIFDKAKHLEWLKSKPEKRPKPKEVREHLSHFYSKGSVCDKTGKPRQTEVRLRCLKNASSPNQVSLYLLEPEFCKYILGVESPLICDILDKADENGLVPYEEEPFLDESVDVNIVQV